MKKIIGILGAVLALNFALVSCNDISSDESDSSPSLSASSNKSVAYAKISLNNLNERSIFPTIGNDDISEAKFTLSKEGSTDPLGSWNSLDEMVGDNIAIEGGTYTFTLKADLNGTKLQGTLENKEIKSGSPNYLSFDLERIGYSSEGTGNADVTLNLPGNVKSAKLEVKKISGSGFPPAPGYGKVFPTIQNSKISFTDEVDSGSYLLTFTFYADEGTADPEAAGTQNIGTYSEVITVAKGLTSKKEITIDNLASLLTVKYNPNGGDFTAFNENFTKNSSYTTKTTADNPDIKRTGYVFEGWFEKDASGELTGDRIESWSANTRTEDVNLYAKWESVSYRVKIHNLGADDVTADVKTSWTTEGTGDNALYIKKFNSSEDVNLTSLKFEKTGYTYVGLFTKDDFSDSAIVSWKAGDYMNADGYYTTEPYVLNLYAKFTINKFKVTYDFGGAKDASGAEIPSEEKTDIKYGTAASDVKLDSDPEWAGHNFEGWYNGDDEYNFDSEEITKDITLTAKWSATGLSIIKINNPSDIDIKTSGKTVSIDYKGSDSISTYTWVINRDNANAKTGNSVDFTEYLTTAQNCYVYVEGKTAKGITLSATFQVTR